MARCKLSSMVIRGISAAVPKTVARTEDYSAISVRERELFQKTTGVRERRIVSGSVTTSDLCVSATYQLMDDLRWSPSDIGAMIFVSQSPDYYLPATSILLQKRLNFSHDCWTFDVGLGCSGYVNGLAILGGIMETYGIDRGLLLAGDVSSVTCHYQDKSTYPLFGDAGTATALERKIDAPPIYFRLKNDGSGYDKIMIKDGGMRNRISPESFELRYVSAGIKRTDLNLQLDGVGVFHFSLKDVPPIIMDVLSDSGVSKDEIDSVILHQANKLINSQIERKLALPTATFPSSIESFGNTSSASIPVTMVTQMSRQLTRKQHLILSGFGVGLSWASMYMHSDSILCSKLVEVE